MSCTPNYLSFIAVLIAGCGPSCSGEPSATPHPNVQDAALDQEVSADGSPTPPDAGDDVKEAGPPLTARCIERWPTFQPSSPKPSLQVQAPELLWTRPIPTLRCQSQPTMTREQLAVSCANRFNIFDLSGNNTFTTMTWTSISSAAVADSEGNFVFGTANVQSVTPNGAVRWLYRLGASLGLADIPFTSNLLLSPEGVVHFAATDGTVNGLRASDGQVVYSRILPDWDTMGDGYLTGGVGDTFFIDGFPHHAGTGERHAKPVIDGKTAHNYMAISSGVVAQHHKEVSGARYTRLYVTDPCGEPLWSAPDAPGRWDVLAEGFAGETLILNTMFVSGQALWEGEHNAYIYSREGERLRGPVPIGGNPLALGADNTIYVQECGPAADPNDWHTAPMTLVAYSWDLEEKWSLDLGTPCPMTGLFFGGIVALGDDGVMYMIREQPNSTELIAVQTQSPGLAPTPVPINRNNNQRTGWLAGSP